MVFFSLFESKDNLIFFQLQEKVINKDNTYNLSRKFIVLQSHNFLARITSIIISTTDSKKVGEPKN